MLFNSTVTLLTGQARLSVVGKAYQTKCVFFVDDEPKVCQAVAKTLGQIGFEVRCFTRPVDCFEQLRRHPCDLLITDLKMPGMDGMELLGKVKCLMPSLPVLIVTGYGDIATAVKAVKAGAYDFIEKPLSRQVLISAVTSILEETAANTAKRKPLTHGEMTVLRLILAGKNNREVAALLYRSVKTIDFHRANIMRKLDAHNAVELAERAIALVPGLRRYPDIGG